MSTISKTVLISLLTALTLYAQSHPRLFVTPERVTEIKSAIQVEDSHHKLAFTQLKARVDQNDYSIYNDNNSGYKMSYLAREAAMMYLLTEEASYAAIAYETLQKVYSAENDEVRIPSGSAESVNGKRGKDYGLSRAMMCLGFAIAYDWCYSGWTQEQRNWVKGKLIKALDAWPSYSHTNLGGTKGSNWVAVCRGGELVAMLAAQEEQNRLQRFDRLKSDLVQHMISGYGDMGISQEGVAYTEYAGHFLLSAVQACSSIGDNTLFNQVQKHEFWTRALYSHTFQDPYRKILQMGVDNRNYDEGWASFLLGLTPQEELQYVTWWYDRHLGRLSNRSEDSKYDFERAGTVWSLIYYPENISPADPISVYPKSLGDDRGYYYFRNRWQDQNDILFSVHADAHHHDKAWDQSEAGALGLMAYNTRFIGGPGKDREAQKYSMLLVDGKSPDDKKCGEIVSFEQSPDGGYVVIDGGDQYSGLGIASYQRHTAVKFLNDNTAIIAVLDKISDDQEHNYTFNLNIGDASTNDDVTVSKGTEQQHGYFLLSGRNDGFVKGWAVSPSEASVSASDPVQITPAKSASMDLLVVMFVGSGEAPVAEISGSGMESVVKIHSHDITVVDDRIQITGPSTHSVRQPQKAIQNVEFDRQGHAFRAVININSPQRVSGALYDLAGRKVFSFAKRSLESGTHDLSYRIPGGKLSKGMYMMRIDSDKGNLLQTNYLID
ncbi:MAG: T9SS type A sorting domain-containing protein [Chitinispirillaceae bacterium]